MNSLITDTAITDAKFMLMSSSPIDHLRAVQWIWEIVNYASGDERDRLINRLIDADVVSYLCERTGEHHGLLFTIMLKIVDKLRFNYLFYKYKLAYRAIGSIVRVASIMSQNLAAHEETLALAAYTIYVVLDGASTAQVSLDYVCNVEQMVLFIKNLCPPLSKKYILRLSAARTLILVMEHIELGNDEEVQSSLLLAFTDSLASMRAMVLQHIDSMDSGILHHAMEIVISTCAIGTRFCEETGNSAQYISSITEELTEIIIPNFSKVKFPAAEYEKNQQKLIECLATILHFNTCDRKQVIEFLVDKTDLLTILRDKGFADKSCKLSGVCVNLLACIVECQRRLRVQSASNRLQGEVVKIDPLKILDLLAQSDYEIRRAAMRLLIALLIPGEAIPSGILFVFESVEAVEKTVCLWYMKLYSIFPKTQTSDWRLVYSCLCAVLNFCKKNKYLRILRHLCEFSGTRELVRTTIDHEYTDPTFFEFVNVWMHLRFSNVERVQFRCSKNLANYESEFDEIVEMLTHYREKLANSGRNT